MSLIFEEDCCIVTFMSTMFTYRASRPCLHRRSGSLIDQSCAGPLLMAEIKALDRIINKTKKPIVAVVGGSKVSTKIDLLENLALKTDHLIVGGGIANSLLRAGGAYVGNSLVEEKSEETARRLIQDYSNIILPEDVVCAKTFSKSANGKAKAIDAIEEDDQILDFGPNSLKQMSDLISSAETIIWNGPVGVFEFKNFETGTRTIGESIANSKAYSVAGGRYVAAINKFKLRNKISYVSTAGGAFLEYLKGEICRANATILRQQSPPKSLIPLNDHRRFDSGLKSYQLCRWEVLAQEATYPTLSSPDNHE